MINRSAGAPGRSHSWRIGRLVASLAAVIAALAGLAAFASAQVGNHEPALPNPALTAKCGNLRIILVLDESSSISAADVTRTQDAARAFVRGLNGTGTELAIDAFALNARRLIGYHEVNNVNTPSFNTAINTLAGAGVSRAGTNWDAAFRQVETLNASTTHADLVVFMTDGNPNTYVGGPAASETQAGWERSIGPAVASANRVKTQGSRIFALGVGAALSSADSVGRLQAVSGTSEFPTPNNNFFTADFTLNHDFTQFEAALSTIVSRLCGSSLEITKEVQDHNGDIVDASGWSFTATLASQGHQWLIPESFGSEASAHNTTLDNGVAPFHWTLNTPGTADLSATHETPKNGFHFISALCSIHHPDGTVTELPVNTEQIPALSIATEGFATCNVFNKGPGALLTVRKVLQPSSDPGRFDLLVNGRPRLERAGNGDSTGRIVLPLGTHTVSERVTAAQSHTIHLSHYSISTRCVNSSNGHVVAHGTGTHPVAVHLGHETDNIVCTITNHRTGPPPPGVKPPGPPVIPSPPGPGPHLSVVKTMPPRARVAELVPITVTVHNLGHGTAQGVQLAETRPAGLRIVSVANHGTIQHGAAIWHLGNLAPGASRTVHATARVLHPGVHVDTAVAVALNADPALSGAAVHAARRPSRPHRPPPPPPRFTG
jgi:uncharacterized protein YegL